MDSEAFNQGSKLKCIQGSGRSQKWCELAVSNDQGVMKPETN